MLKIIENPALKASDMLKDEVFCVSDCGDLTLRVGDNYGLSEDRHLRVVAVVDGEGTIPEKVKRLKKWIDLRTLHKLGD